jgi:hypothetical protein
MDPDRGREACLAGPDLLERGVARRDRAAGRQRLGQGLAAAFALILGASTPCAQAAAQVAGATSEARSRPLYREVLRQCELRSATTRSQVDARLAAWIDEWSASEYGLEDERDPDRVLASTTALSQLARDADRAEELHALLLEIEAKLAPVPRSDPDLSLALAQGWLALLTVPRAAEVPADELARSLDFAFQNAAAIDPADRRDAFGSRLAHELYRLLHASGRGREAVEVLERALAQFPGDPEARPYLLAALADERRTAGEWSRAWARLSEAEEARAALEADGLARDLRVLERTLAGVRCQLELAWVLPDQAVQSYERERRAFDAGARDPESHLDLLLNASGVALATGRPSILGSSLARFEKELGQEQLFADRPAARAQLLARQALMRALLEDVDPGAEPRATALLAAAFEDEALDEAHRASLVICLFERALADGDLDAAADWLERPARAQGAQELTAFLVAARAKVALARAADREELERHIAEVRAQYEAFLRSFRERPEREGGLAYLAWRSRRLLLGTVLELALALDGEEHAVDALLPQQALGSLARRLECKPGTLAEARKELLGPGTGLLLYLPGWRSTHLFCVDSGDVVHAEIPWDYDIEQPPRELADLLSSSPSTFSEGERARQLANIEELARGLAARLLPEVARERLRRWKGVYLAGVESLGALPFECFPLDGVRLGERIALAYLPSLPVGLELARRPPRKVEEGGLDLILVAAPELAGATSRRYLLASFALEGASASALTSPFARSLLLTGKEARWSRVCEELASGAPRVLHLLLHGVNDPTRELSGGLALASDDGDSDGLLWCEELLSAGFASPPLVILSACGSARGPRRVGDDGLWQLGGAFLSHGALCTVQAAGDIALEPTLALTASFTRELARDSSPAEAMRSARAELAPGLGHPFYACSLRVVGLGLEAIPR